MKMQDMVHLSARTFFSNPPRNRRQMAVEKMKVKPRCKRLIRSISSWMPRSNRSGSAKSGPRRSRNTLLTTLAAGIKRSSVDRRFMGIIIRNQLPSSSIFCRKRHSANRQEQVAGQQVVGGHSPAHCRLAHAGGGLPIEEVMHNRRVAFRQRGVVGTSAMGNHRGRPAHQELPCAEKTHELLRQHANQLPQSQTESAAAGQFAGIKSQRAGPGSAHCHRPWHRRPTAL